MRKLGLVLLVFAIGMSGDCENGMPEDGMPGAAMPFSNFGDSDGDGLLDSTESQLGTDPNSTDTDGDGLSDGDEVNIHGTDPLLLDTDFDGLSDSEEVDTYLTNPLSADTDFDGLSDGLEVNPLVGTDPLNPDTDGDSLDDGVEVDASLDPLFPNPIAGVSTICDRFAIINFCDTNPSTTCIYDACGFISCFGSFPSLGIAVETVSGDVRVLELDGGSFLATFVGGGSRSIGLTITGATRDLVGALIITLSTPNNDWAVSSLDEPEVADWLIGDEVSVASRGIGGGIVAWTMVNVDACESVQVFPR